MVISFENWSLVVGVDHCGHISVTCMHACIHTHTHTHTHAHTHTYIVRTHMYSCRRKHSWMHTQTHAHICISVLLSYVCSIKCFLVQVQADVVQQAFDKVGGEGIIPTHFDPEIGEISIDFSTLLEEKKVHEHLNTLI